MIPALAVCEEGRVVRPLGPHAWWVRLPNGHELAGVVRRADRQAASDLAAGDRVTVEIRPADFSRGRLRFAGSANAARE